MSDELLTSLSVIHVLYTNIWFNCMMIMSCNLRAFSSLAAKRRYTLKSPALAFLKLNMYAVKCDSEQEHDFDLV